MIEDHSHAIVLIALHSWLPYIHCQCMQQYNLLLPQFSMNCCAVVRLNVGMSRAEHGYTWGYPEVDPLMGESEA